MAEKHYQRRHREWALKQCRTWQRFFCFYKDDAVRFHSDRADKAEAELDAMIELEASVCPEDFGCHEYIPKLEARVKELIGALEKAKTAWEYLGEGHYPPKVIENWLVRQMKPAMREVRAALAEKEKPCTCGTGYDPECPSGHGAEKEKV